jgi:nucleotide-binding universal stress UspA family protein
MIEMERILYPCDFSENSRKILPYVLSLSQKYNSTIHLLHVVGDLLKWGGFYVPHPSLTQYQTELLKGVEKKMEEICEDQMQGCKDFKRIIVSGDPAQEILKAIEVNSIDLVIMGTHGYKGLQHTIFGSVAENVVKKSPVPVLVINPYKVGEKERHTVETF